MAVASTLPPQLHVASRPQEPEVERLTPERLERENLRHDRILAGLLVLLTFLLASFPVTNADVWMHLRVGQMIVEGEYTFGQDPFCYTTEDAYWSNPAWLTDVLFYGLYQLGGGPALVLLRGLLFVALTILLLRIRLPRGSLYVSVFTVGLGVFAATPRLFVRPELFSVLFLAATFYLLWKPAREPRAGLLKNLHRLTPGRLWVFLPFLFLLWVNMDQWFLLGLVMVGLYLLGETLHDKLAGATFRKEGMTGADRKRLLYVLLASVAACLVNPHTYHVFEIPGELWSPAVELQNLYEPQVRRDVSPFDFSKFREDWRTDRLWFRPRGLSLAEWCYFPLVLLGAASFLLNRRYWSWSRALVWVAFFALSAWQTRNVAFFAVVAAPITALNLQDWLRARFGDRPTLQRRWVAGGQLARILTLAGYVVMVCAVVFAHPHEPGLQRPGREAPLGVIHQRGALGWSMLVDASLEQSARQLADWRRSNTLPGQSFAMQWYEQPAYAAFFGPENLSFVDMRPKLHEETVNEYYDVYLNLRRVGEVPPETLDGYWQPVFRKHNISHLIISGQMRVPRTDPRTKITLQVPLVHLLLLDRERGAVPGELGRRKWQQLDYSDGRTFVLAWTGWQGWKDPRSPHWDKLQKLKSDPEREAFREPKAPAPLRGLVQAHWDPPLKQWLAGEIRRRPIACDETQWQIQLAQEDFATVQEDVQVAALRLALQFPGTVLSGVPMPPLPPVTEQLTGARALLAVRAGRRAVVDNPAHGESYYYLYQAYDRLQQVENYVLAVNNPIREVQRLAALRQAALLLPDGPGPHMDLAGFYFSQNVPDHGIAHFQKAVEAYRLLGNGTDLEGERLEQFRAELAQRAFGLSIDRAETRFRQLRAEYNAKARNMRDAIERGYHALSLRLADQARIDLQMAVDQMSPDGPFTTRDNAAFRSLLELYLSLGYRVEARLLLSRPDAASRLQPLGFHQLGAQVAAAEGNYELALRHFEQLDAMLKEVSVERALEGLKTQTLGGQSEPSGSNLAGVSQLYEGFNVLRLRADQLCQMGLLALEAGRPADAAEYFRRAVTEVHADSTYRPWASRYYYLIAGKRLVGPK